MRPARARVSGGCAGGLPLAALRLHLQFDFPNFEAFLETGSPVLVGVVYAVQRLVLILSHASALVWLLQTGWWRGLTARLTAVGRMALTNYQIQTAGCTLIFYGYGPGLYGQVGYGQLLGVAGVIWVVQVPLSAWWLRRFHFGPVEWAWRALTYGWCPPWRR